MTVKEKTAALRDLMRERGIDAFLIPTDDYHCSEYVGDHFKCRSYLTGFTGSAGTALVTQDFAGLWTDGRYFIQAADQLKGSGITLMKMGQEDVPTIREYLLNTMSSGQVLGFDGRTMTAKKGEELETALKEIGVSIDPSADLIGRIWTDRPSLSCRPVWELSVIYAGKERRLKIRELRKALAEKKADFLLLSSLADIAWLLNLRGNDIACTPVFLSYLIVSQSRVRLFAQDAAFSDEIRESLRKDGVELLPYDAVYEFLEGSPAGLTCLMDPDQVNLALRRSIPDRVTVLCEDNPTLLPKACKNSVETANMKKAHIYDGAAVTKFICRLKKLAASCADGEVLTLEDGTPFTELDAVDYLESLRREGRHYMGPSFDYIIAYGPHAAITHYAPSEATNVPLRAKGFVLADTGGHYLEGTTDITRTIALGSLTEEEKIYFTRVLRGNLALARAKFPYGCTGRTLDYAARQPLWEIGEDYNHGTGHGVGYLLGVHEGPNGFRWKAVPERVDDAVYEEGMITSDEPGYYREGAFGIRHENMMVCRKAGKTECGQFMEFETLTLVPFDLDAVIPELMTPQEIGWLNDYHQTVYDRIAPLVDEETKAWLKEATRPIG